MKNLILLISLFFAFACNGQVPSIGAFQIPGIQQENNDVNFLLGTSASLGNYYAPLAYSYDGEIWNAINTENFSPSSVTSENGISYFNDLWIYLNYKSIFYSSDGLNYSLADNSLFSSDMRGMISTNSIAIIIGKGTYNSLAYSYDGINWTGVGKSVFSNYCAGIDYNGTYFMAVGSTSSASKYAISTDGINWSGGSTGYFSFGYSVAWNGTYWIVSGYNTSGLYNFIYSTDGTSWTASNDVLFTYVDDLKSSGSITLACGIGTPAMAYSYNGIDWTAISSLPVGKATCFFFDESTSIWYVGGQGGEYLIATSSDGINWTGVPIPDISLSIVRAIHKK